MQTVSIIDLAQRLKTLDNQIGILEDELSALKKEKSLIEGKILPDAMEDNGVESVRLEGIGTLFLKHDAYVSYLKEDEELVFEHLSDINAEHLIKETVNPATFKAFIKTQAKNGEFIPEFIKYNPYTKAQIRKGR